MNMNLEFRTLKYKHLGDKYYALYTLSKSAITIDQIEFYKIISEFIKNNIRVISAVFKSTVFLFISS